MGCLIMSLLVFQRFYLKTKYVNELENDTIQEEVVEYKVYKEKPYLNSDREPFGVTLNGKTKEYILAHGAIKELMKKGKIYPVRKGYLKVLDVTHNKAMLNAILEVSVDEEGKGTLK